MRDFELIAFKCEWKHIYIAIILIRWSMPVNKLNYDVFTSYSLIEFNIPFNYFQILKTPNPIRVNPSINFSTSTIDHAEISPNKRVIIRIIPITMYKA